MMGGARLRRLAGSVLDIADDWHRGVWRAGLLHWELDVPLIIEESGGWGVLGATANDQGYYCISLSCKVVHTRLQPVVYGHECVHCILDLLSDGGCRLGWLHQAEERDTWAVTPVVLVPTAFAAMLVRRGVSEGEVSEHMGVPLPVVRMRLALHQALHARRWQARYLAELAQAQDDLQRWMVAEVYRLSVGSARDWQAWTA